MKKILIIGASALQLPVIIKAKEMGYYVAVVDKDINSVGKPLADTFYQVSTVDEVGILQVAKEFKPNGIITLATDMPVRSIAYVSKKLNLHSISYQTALKATDKGLMMETLKQSSVPVPWFYLINSISELTNIINSIEYPCICKPVDSSGSRGVILVNDEKDMIDAYNYSLGHSKSKGVLVEEYMQGPEYSVEVLVIRGEVNVLQITDKFTTGPPNFVEQGHSQPAMLSLKDKEAIIKLTKRALKALGITSGPAHVEIIRTSSGPMIVELGARMGGDYIASDLVYQSTGIDFLKCAIEECMGLDPDIGRHWEKQSAILYVNLNEGIVDSVAGIDEVLSVNGIVDFKLNVREGDRISRVNNSANRHGHIIGVTDGQISATDLCREALSKLKIVVN